MSDYPKAEWLVVPGTKLVVAVQDTFGGRTLRRVNGDVHSGEIYSRRCNYLNSLQAPGEDGKGTNCFRIIEQVHANTVRAVLRRAGIDRKLERGLWYRVIED